MTETSEILFIFGFEGGIMSIKSNQAQLISHLFDLLRRSIDIDMETIGSKKQ
jgi:hypothetical protein